MKPLLPIGSRWELMNRLAALLLTVTAFCVQNAMATGGTVTFANHSSTKIIKGQTLNPITSGDGIKAALYWAPTNSSAFVQIGAATNVGVPVPGIFCGGTRTTGPATTGGSVGQFLVRAWGGGLPTYEQAAITPGVLIGQSVVVQVVTGNPEGDAPTPPGSLIAGGLQGFTLVTNSFQPLTFVCPQNKTVEIGTAWTFDSPTASGGCANPAITILNTATNGSCPQIASRTWQITDGCSTNTCTQAVTITDTTPPLVTCSSNKTVACGSAWDFDLPIASDVGSGTNVLISVSVTLTNGSCPTLVTRTWLAMDACGNTNQCSQTVSITDLSPLTVQCSTNKIVTCDTNWDFDAPIASSACGSSVSITVLATVTNSNCPRTSTRTWGITNLCTGNSTVCSQIVTLLCPDCPVLALTKNCPTNPVPPGGILTYTATVTNVSDLVLSNVVVWSDHPLTNTVVFGPATLSPGEGASFGSSYTVGVNSQYTDTLTANGTSSSGIVFSNSLTSSCLGATTFVPGDRNGDGIIDQSELNAVLANYWTNNSAPYMTNAMSLGGGVYQVALTNLAGLSFSVFASTNLENWTLLPGQAYPVFQFVDPEATNAPARFYQLRWP